MQTKKRQEIKSIIQPIIAEDLRRYRNANGLSQEGMAKKLKISVRTYVDLEHSRSMVSATTLAFFLALLPEEELNTLLQSMREAIER